MLTEFKPVDRWLRPNIWLPVMTKSYYFAEKMKKLKSKQWLLKKKRLGNIFGIGCKMHLKYTGILEYSSVTTLNICNTSN